VFLSPSTTQYHFTEPIDPSQVSGRERVVAVDLVTVLKYPREPDILDDPLARPHIPNAPRVRAVLLLVGTIFGAVAWFLALKYKCRKATDSDKTKRRFFVWTGAGAAVFLIVEVLFVADIFEALVKLCR